MDTLKNRGRLFGYKREFLQAQTLAACVLLFCALPASAQGKKAVQAVRAASETQVKTTPAALPPGARRRHALREHGGFNAIEPTVQRRLRVRFPEVRALQKQALMARYYRVMDDFSSFKKELDVKLFYQILPGEGRAFDAREKNDLFTRMGTLSARIGALEAGAFRGDGGLSAARKYLAEAAGRIDPMFVGAFGQRGRVRSDRKFDEDEFFLRKSVSWWRGGDTQGDWVLFGVRRSRKAAAKLPIRRIAVLNDQTEPIVTFQDWHFQGGFGPNIELAFYMEAEALLNAVGRGETFDMILTDIMVPGGGGAYVVSELRDRDLNIPVIAFTQYEETPHLAMRLFAAGFDGMIHADPYFGSFNGDMLSLVNKLNRYFYYRDLHNWAR